MQSLFGRLMPFIFVGIMVVLAVVGVILFSYLLIFGALVGLVLFAITWLRGLFSHKKTRQLQTKQHKTGQTIDHDSLP